MNTETMIETYQHIKDLGWFNYGTVMDRMQVYSMFGYRQMTDEEIDNLPPDKRRKAIKQEGLEELKITDFLRVRLMREGRFLVQEKDNFRIALASENVEHANAYMSQAQRKIRRAKVLLKNTPQDAISQVDSMASRILMGERSSRRVGVQ